MCLTLSHGLQHARPPCPSSSPGGYPNSCPLCQWCHPTISSSVFPFFPHPQSFPASGSYQMSQLVPHIRWPKYWSFSFRISPWIQSSDQNIQVWFPLRCSGWISVQSRGLLRVFSNTTVQKHQFTVLSFLISPTPTSIHDYWKKHSLD